MKNLPRVRLSAPTICFVCGGQLFEGQEVAAIWDIDLSGWKHRHTRSGLCHHRRKRELEVEKICHLDERQRLTPISRRL